jgi:undecaprenyl diphosphate synthase
MRETARAPSHVAIIMDGNGRWAKARGLPRAAGHRAGMNALHDTVRNASELGIRYLTLYAFSSENWSRPVAEVSDLLGLLKIFIRRDLADLHRSNVEVKIIGNRTGLKPDILKLLEEAEQLTRGNDAMTLIIAFNYGSRDEILRASLKLVRDVADGRLSIEDVGQSALTARLDTAGIPDPDLLIRTSGEVRLSNFLMWQAAYAELVFVPCYWPDFDKAQLASALDEFDRRERRFGGLEAQVS